MDRQHQVMISALFDELEKIGASISGRVGKVLLDAPTKGVAGFGTRAAPWASAAGSGGAKVTAGAAPGKIQTLEQKVRWGGPEGFRAAG